jgi:acyl-coenzyme A thioesterase PaaI-like protein
MTVHFLRPVFPDAPSSELTARGRVTHRGRTIAVTTCEIMDSTGRLLAQASGSTLILPGRPWQRPVNVGEEITQDGVGAAT